MRDVKPLVEVAIDGEGVSPKDVPVRQLIELLEATASAVEAVAREHGTEPPALRLIGVREGSAAYELYSDAPNAEAVVRDFYQAAKERGANSGPSVCKALSRLHSAGKGDQIRITTRTPDGKKRARPVYVSTPVESQAAQSEMAAEYYGRIVGLSVRNEQTFVRLRLDDGGTEEFRAKDEVEARAGLFFNKLVRVYVVHTLHGTEVNDGIIEMMSEWADENLLDVMRSIRNDLTKKGVAVDVEAWLQELGT